jgi:hypothetical protein
VAAEAGVSWSAETKAFTHEPPFDHRFELAVKRIRLMHGSPANPVA